jgi:hypothetical protein
LVAAAIATIAASCAAPSTPLTLDSVASRYIQLAQDLARHEPSLVDHWLTGSPPPASVPRQPVATLRGAADALVQDLDSMARRLSGAEQGRASWLAGQARALQFAARRLLGESVPFEEEARLALGITPSPADPAAVAQARAQLERELPGAGPLNERLTAFKVRFQVPEAARSRVMGAALDACREVTFDFFPMPEDEQVDVAFVAALPWDAHARYVGDHHTHIDVNGAAPLDLTRALRLACHEGYAGHHAQHIWLADELVARRGWREYGLIPGFGPALVIAEGAADAGTDLAMPPERRTHLYASVLAPAAGIDRPLEDFARLVRVEQAQAMLEPLIGELAREYLDNRLTAATTAERLEKDVLVASGDAFVPFIERRRTRILAYTEGRRRVTELLDGAGLAGLHGIFVPPR